MTSLMQQVAKLIATVAVCATVTAVVAEQSSANTASNKTGCALKIEQIERQVGYAKAQGNSHRQAGLEKALARVKERCTDDYLRQELDTKVTKKQYKVAERQAELTAAQNKGDTKKIAKQQQKLVEAQQELATAEQELKSYFK